MRYQEKLKKLSKEQIWQEYCGFLDLSISDYMYIQKHLMQEQLDMWGRSGLGKTFLEGKVPSDIEEFRKEMPLTHYEDYADVLLSRRADMLPGEPVIWIQTTWEGGLKPIKLAPYTRGMLETYKHNVLSVLMLSAARNKGEVNVQKGDTILYGGAPLPFASGLAPSLLEESIDLLWMPDTNRDGNASFNTRIKKGFEMAYQEGIDYFFALGSVANYITESFSKGGGGRKGKMKVSPTIAYRYLKAKYISKRDQRPMVPGDVFRLKGFISAGNDASYYRDKLAQTWNVMPIEIAAGTESTCIATETWEHNGIVFFPDACFYEFIPEPEMRRGMEDPAYTPRTCLMDGVIAGETYELVISVLKGGAFMRYRIGDMYHCVSGCAGGVLPRFAYVDRVPTIIDIAGFTRINEKMISEVIRLSKLGIGDWLAKKEYDAQQNPYLHMYIEIDPDQAAGEIVSKQLLYEHLTAYFKYFDSDYNDLKKLLNIDPLKITILKSGTISRYQKSTGRHVPKINPSALDVSEIVSRQVGRGTAETGGVKGS